MSLCVCLDRFRLLARCNPELGRCSARAVVKLHRYRLCTAAQMLRSACVAYVAHLHPARCATVTCTRPWLSSWQIPMIGSSRRAEHTLRKAKCMPFVCVDGSMTYTMRDAHTHAKAGGAMHAHVCTHPPLHACVWLRIRKHIQASSEDHKELAYVCSSNVGGPEIPSDVSGPETQSSSCGDLHTSASDTQT